MHLVKTFKQDIQLILASPEAWPEAYRPLLAARAHSSHLKKQQVFATKKSGPSPFLRSVSARRRAAEMRANAEGGGGACACESTINESMHNVHVQRLMTKTG